MRFRSIVLLTVLGLLAAILAATVASVAIVIGRAANVTLTEDLQRGMGVFADLRQYRESLFRTQSRVMAEEPRLKAVVDTQDVTHETVFGVALDLRKAVQSDLFLVADASGRLLADVADPTAIGFDLTNKPVISGALLHGDASDIWTHDGHAYQVVARRLMFGTTVVGVLVLGYEIDDRLADTVYRQTGAVTVIELGDAVIGLAGLANRTAADRAKAATALAALGTGAHATEISVLGTRFLAVAAPYPGRTEVAKTPMRYVLMRSLDLAREPVNRVTEVLYAIAAAALLAGFWFALRLSRRLSRPVDALVQLTETVSAGNLDQQVEVFGPIEVRTLGTAMNRMVAELSASRERLADQERMGRELEIATRIQTAVLPRMMEVRGLEIAAQMIPAEDVGGDYYDVLPIPSGAWIGVGDVAGHGLTAGLVMMMIQSVVSALVRERASASPAEILAVLNHTLYDNIRVRLEQDEHVTMTLFYYEFGGKLVYAGAHEEFIVCRATGGACERIETPGTWLGAVDDIRKSMVCSELTLLDGDLLVLYTDGLIQATNEAGEQFGMDRLCKTIEDARVEPAESIRTRLIEAVLAFQSTQLDDITVLVIRYRATV